MFDFYVHKGHMEARLGFKVLSRGLENDLSDHSDRELQFLQRKTYDQTHDPSDYKHRSLTSLEVLGLQRLYPIGLS